MAIAVVPYHDGGKRGTPPLAEGGQAETMRKGWEKKLVMMQMPRERRVVGAARHQCMHLRQYYNVDHPDK
jgi:hypothetical protein